MYYITAEAETQWELFFFFQGEIPCVCTLKRLFLWDLFIQPDYRCGVQKYNTWRCAVIENQQSVIRWCEDASNVEYFPTTMLNIPPRKPLNKSLLSENKLTITTITHVFKSNDVHTVEQQCHGRKSLNGVNGHLQGPTSTCLGYAIKTICQMVGRRRLTALRCPS